MGSKNFMKVAQGTHPPKSGNFGRNSVIKFIYFSGNSLIKYSFLAVNYCTRRDSSISCYETHCLYDSNHCRTTLLQPHRGHYQLGYQHQLFVWVRADT